MRLRDVRGETRLKFNYGLWFLINHILPPGRAKNWALRRMGAKIHHNAWISPNVLIDPVYPELVHVHESAFIGWGSKIFAHRIALENGKDVPEGELYFSSDLKIPVQGHIWAVRRAPVHIHGFVGGDCTVEHGCKIHGILGAHSYLRANKTIKEDEYWFGIPAKKSEKNGNDHA